MLFVTTYRLKPYISHDEFRKLMALFAEHGSSEGTFAHYVAADGSLGMVIAETDDAAKEYRNILNYGEYLDFDTKVMLTIDDALPHIFDALGVE
jgi:hypothetical protein